MQQENDIPAFIHRTNPRSRSVRVSISPKGEIIVTTPPQFPTSRVIPFLRQSQPWLEKHVALHKRRLRVTDEQSVLYLGKSLRITITTSPRPPAIEIVGNRIIVNPVELSEDSLSRAIIRWLKSESERYIIPRVVEIAKTSGHSYSSMQLRDQTSRWGSCSNKGNLQFSWRLIQAPTEVIDYVIMHELAHLKHMDHSQRFWNYVEKLDPHYADHKKWLRLHGAALHQDFRFDPAMCDSV